MPDLRIPIGFLPVVLKTRWGRFTAPDPARDLRGDGDLYDYCVDDPVSRLDTWGLAWVPLVIAAIAFIGGKAGGLGLGLGGAYGAAKAADAMGSGPDGKESARARDGVRAVAPHVAGASAVSTVGGIAPALVTQAPAAYVEAAQRAAAIAHSMKYGDKAIKAAKHATQFAEPFIVPGPPTVISGPGSIGTIMYETQRYYNKNK